MKISFCCSLISWQKDNRWLNIEFISRQWQRAHNHIGYKLWREMKRLGFEGLTTELAKYKTWEDYEKKRRRKYDRARRFNPYQYPHKILQVFNLRFNSIAILGSVRTDYFEIHNNVNTWGLIIKNKECLILTHQFFLENEEPDWIKIEKEFERIVFNNHPIPPLQKPPVGLRQFIEF